jgi:hypothetical protein
MRQGGMKPKGHNSGVYWVRAGAKSGGGRKKKTKTKHKIGIDTDGDGVADTFGDIVESSHPPSRPRISGDVMAFVVAVIVCALITIIV